MSASSTPSAGAALVRLALTVGVTGLVAGALGGWWGLWRAEGAHGVADAAAPAFWLLALLAPVALALGAGADAGARASAVDALRLAVAGAVGGLLAAALFVVAASQVPAVFGAEAAEALVRQLRERIFWQGAGPLAALTAATGLVRAAWRPHRPPP